MAMLARGRKAIANTGPENASFSRLFDLESALRTTAYVVDAQMDTLVHLRDLAVGQYSYVVNQLRPCSEVPNSAMDSPSSLPIRTRPMTRSMTALARGDLPPSATAPVRNHPYAAASGSSHKANWRAREDTPHPSAVAQPPIPPSTSIPRESNPGDDGGVVAAPAIQDPLPPLSLGHAIIQSWASDVDVAMHGPKAKSAVATADQGNGDADSEMDRRSV